MPTYINNGIRWYGTITIPAPLTVIEQWVDAGRELGLSGVEFTGHDIVIDVGGGVINIAPDEAYDETRNE